MKIESSYDIWNLVCEEIKKSVSEIAFDVWLKDLHPIELKGNEFTLAINSEYKKQIVESNYLQYIPMYMFIDSMYLSIPKDKLRYCALSFNYCVTV